MQSEAFNHIVKARCDLIQSILASKAKEYAIDDRLYNFKRAAEILRITPQRALFGMFMKHLVSVIDLVEGSIQPTRYLIDEKIGDAINYLILLEAILKEQNPLINETCLACGDCSNGDIKAGPRA